MDLKEGLNNLEIDSIQADINADIKANEADTAKEISKDFSKMSKANLAKQDKKLLISYAKENSLLNGKSEREIQRLNRKDLADIIKPTRARVKKDSTDTEQDQPHTSKEIEAVVTQVLQGNLTPLDTMAQNVIKNDLIGLVSNSGGEMDEATLKKIKIAKFIGSAVYLGVRLSGGVSAWKIRLQNAVSKIKSKLKKKS